jgi:hypothetical protein
VARGGLAATWHRSGGRCRAPTGHTLTKNRTATPKVIHARTRTARTDDMASTEPTLASLAAEIKLLKDDASAQAGNLDILWLLFGAYLVFFMQAGFAMLEAGAYTRSLQSYTSGPSGHIAHVGARLWLRDASTG